MTNSFDLHCANCGRELAATDKFCRECGLPTVRRAQEFKMTPAPPDTGEFRRALAEAEGNTAMPSPAPLEELKTAPAPPGEETTGDVVRLTHPTLALPRVTSTAIMLVIVLLLALGGIVFLILAFKP